MNVIKLDRKTLDNMMLTIINRKDTWLEKETDNDLFIKCAYKFAEMLDYETTDKGQGHAATRRNEPNRSRIRSNARKQKVGRRNTDVAV